MKILRKQHFEFGTNAIDKYFYMEIFIGNYNNKNIVIK